MLLQIQGLAKAYAPGQAVLQDLDLHLEAGETVALVGRSGSGKSTLINLIAALERPDRGNIEINGQTLAGLSDRRASMLRRSQLGIVFQSFNLLPTLSVAENLAFPLALNKQKASQRIDALLERLGLAADPDRPASQLSGGEQQRLAVARALIHQPPLVLADEPTASLDLDNARAVIDLLIRFSREQHAGLLLVTHSSDVSSRVDRIVRIEGGRLVAVESD